MNRTIRCYTLLIFIFLFFLKTNAQLAYSMHTLAQGETLSMLAKNYHTTVGDIMRMNGMNAQSQLHTGDKIKIPASGTTVAREPAAETPATTQASSTPKTHVVATGETLYHISQVYKVPLDKLITLNNLKDGSVKVGQTLVLTDGSPSSSSVPPAKTRAEQSVSASPSSSQPAAKEPKPSASVKDNVTTTTTTANNTPVQKEVVSQPAVSAPVNKAPATSDNNTQSNNYPSTSDAPKEGFFASLYGKDGQPKNEQIKSGSAMTFKSASGWADKKYYILMNDAPTGSIVKIRNGKNELYAKVLWSLGDMKENDGLSFRISTAAAAALGIADQKFDLKVSYYE